MTPRQRTLLAVGLFIPMAAIILGTFACLPAPVGDPMTAKVDPALTGAWQGVPNDPADKAQTVVVVQPWDAHTYYVQYLYSETKDGKEENHILNFKAWLADIGGARFIVCEALDDKKFQDNPKEPDTYWWTAKLEAKGDTITATPVDESSELLKGIEGGVKSDGDLKKAGQTLEAIIKGHVDDKTLYKEALTFKKLGKDHLGVVQDLRKKANLGLDANGGGADTKPADAPKGMP